MIMGSKEENCKTLFWNNLSYADVFSRNNMCYLKD